MSTSLTHLLGTALPIVQAPMAGVQGSALALAVCQAGGLGSLPAAALSPDALRAELTLMAAQSQGRPWNVNFFAHVPPVPDAAREAAWRASLAPCYAEYGIDPASIAAGPGRSPFSDEMADLVEPFRPPVVSFHFGLPSPQLLARVRAWGAKVLSSATTVEEALWLQAQGVDAIIAQGLEAGGHRGFFLTRDLSTQMDTFALLPQIVQAVKLPVIAAGGIVNAPSVAAAFALGAAGAQAGTAYLLCPEATTSPVHRAALQSEAARHTALTTLFTGGAARGIVNRAMHELGALDNQAPAFPLATSAIAPLRAAAERAGRGDFTPLWSGQNASACRAVSAAEVTRSLAKGAPTNTRTTRTTSITAIAQALATAHRTGTAWQPTGGWPELNTADAYAIQAAVAAELGWFPDGPRAWKVGGTEDINAAPLPEVRPSPAASHVTWVLPAGQDEVLIEAELAFRLASAPVAPNATDALACLGTVCVSVELIGTRLANGLSAPANWKLADQGVHAGLLIGEEQPGARFTAFTPADWQAQACHIRVQGADGTVAVHESRGSHPAILAGLHPLGTLPWLARHAEAQAAVQATTQTLAHSGGLNAGDLVTTGAWLVVKVRRGDVVDVGFEGLPDVRLHIA